MKCYEEKCRLLKEQLSRYASEDVAVAFSGGVDSSLLLKIVCEAARETGKKVYGVFLRTMLHPQGELEEAMQVAQETGAIFHVIEVDELEEADIADNPADRCYRCKRYLFQVMKEEMKLLQVYRILEGTNEDDLHVYRPGIRAVRELGIVSPLADAGLTKSDVRRLAGEYGISVSGKPSTPCLATRFPYGVRLTYEAMRKVEQGESYLRSLGLGNVRLRVHGNLARLEVDTDDIGRVTERREDIAGYLKNLGYNYVTLDLEGFRTGSMDESVRAIAVSQGD